LRHFKPVVSVALFNLKFVTGIFIWIVYTFYYKDLQNNDVHKFYNDALVLRQAASENPTAFIKLMSGKSDETTAVYTAQMKNWERNFDEAPVNENRTIIKLNALLMFISDKTYLVHILFMCFISLIGWIWIFNSVFDYAGLKPFALSLFVLVLPSVLFWTSGVMKEPLLVFGLGLFTKGLLKLPEQNNFPSISKLLLLVFAGTVVLLSIKFYVLVCLLPAALAFLIFAKEERSILLLSKYIILYGLLLALVLNIQVVLPTINPLQMLVNKEVHSVKEAVYFNAGSRIEIPGIAPTAFSFLKAAPVGIWNTITRPYLWETKNPMMVASAVENAVVLLIILFAVFSGKFSLKHFNLLLFLLAFSLAYFALIGMCTPVLGNLVRYKAPVLPFFLLAFLIASHKFFEGGTAGRLNEKISPYFLAE
jgi:hypothetical protein